ncbi:hypothetical protein ACFE04_026600 [Oxalis oulophora]
MAMVICICESKTPLYRRHHVRMYNNLTEPDQLDWRCEFKDDFTHDVVGPVLIEENGQYFEFGFKENRAESTLYNCDLWYLVSHKYYVGFPAFVSDKKFANDLCGGVNCYWTATYEGIYIINLDTREQIFMHEWKLA